TRSSRARDLSQVPRLVDIDAAMLCEMDSERIKALNETHSVGVGMIWRKSRQACSHVTLTRYQHRRSLAAKIGGNFGQVRAGSICHRKNEHGIIFRNESDGAVLEFGAAERLSMNVANLLKLQGRFACDGERGTAAQYDQVTRGELCAETLRPIELGGRCESIARSSAQRATRSSKAVSDATNVLVAATLTSGPAAIGRTRSQATANGLSVSLTMAAMRAPVAFAEDADSTRSSLRPDCEMARNSWPSSRKSLW